jgi:arylsulfatase A-like enzyme
MRHALLLLLLGAAQDRIPDRLNVLVLYADDWRHDTLGAAGHPVVQTPNLDALAAQGVRFTRACVTTSICGVSRATLLTGQWMSRHGNPAFAMFKTPWDQTWPALLRSRGYWTGHVGKWHNGKFPAEHFDVGRSYSGKHWIGDTHVTAKNERDALDFLDQRPKDRPFALAVAFFAAHAEDSNPKQFLPQPETMDLYKDQVLPVPDLDPSALPPFLASPKNAGRIRFNWRFDTPEKYQQYLKNYYRLVSGVDAACGRLLDALKASGDLDRTFVIFTTDNGYFHGERGLADKWYPYEESIRVPLIVRDPRARKPGVNDDLVLNVDLAPTILAAAGVPAPDRMQGRDFSPLYLAPAPPAWRDEFYYEHAIVKSKDFIPASEALVRKDVKLIRYPDWGTEQLFDLKADPGELKDLIADPMQAARLAQLRARLAELRQAAR